jgi:SAM-dependent methyltransferase
MRLVPSRLRSFPNVREHNWLNHHLIIEFLEECAREHARGTMVDIGCGAKPYEPVFRNSVTSHIGVDIPDSPHGISRIDVTGSAYDTGLPDSSCDVVLCTEVLEHLEDPIAGVREMRRVLTDEGVVILTVPLFWPVHEAPRDFYRYSEYGLRHLFETGGFDILEIRPLTGYIVTSAQLFVYYLERFRGRLVFRTAHRLLICAIQCLALRFNRYDRSTEFTNLYGLVAKRAQSPEAAPRHQR